ncbi:MAG: uroporphyrinogen-III synthase [Chloroherpetonaceae bacterium]|nr:uroporphyrinogen-III synthase [Chloroherpetonaceae bacterium]
MKPLIILTRPILDSESLTTKLKKLDFDVIQIPFIEIRYKKVDFQTLEYLLGNCSSLIFTSVNAVRGLQMNIENNPSINPLLKKKEIYTIGEKTFDSARHFGGEMKSLPAAYHAKSLLELIIKENDRDKNFLFIAGNKSKREIPNWFGENGVKCTTLEIYENFFLKVSESQKSLILESIVRKDACVIFHSPSGVNSFCEQIAKNDIKCALFAIGETTKEEIQKWKLKWGYENEKWTVITPSISNENELIKTVQEFFNQVF